MNIPKDIRYDNEKRLEKKLNRIIRSDKNIESIEQEEFKIRYAWAKLMKEELKCEKDIK